MRKRLATGIPTVGLITALVMAMFLMITAPLAAGESETADGASASDSNVGADPRFDRLAAQGYLSSVAAGDNTWLVFEQTLPFPPFGDTSESRMESVSALLASGGCKVLPDDDAEAFGKKAILDCSEPYGDLHGSKAGDVADDDDVAATSSEMQLPAGLGELHRQLKAEANGLSWSPVNENGAREGEVGACLPGGRSCATVFWTMATEPTER